MSHHTEPNTQRTEDTSLHDWVYAAPSNIHGTGLFARKLLHAGDYIGTYWGTKTQENGTYVLWIYQEDGSAEGCDGENLLRYLNHANPGNCEFDGLDLYAREAILPDEELTFDYQESEFD